jgi:ABC-type sugar transport system ATPase subunit
MPCPGVANCGDAEISDEPNPSVVQMQHISKSFGGVQALRDVHFEIVPGEVHALLGENGAGKLTLINVT